MYVPTYLYSGFRLKRKTIAYIYTYVTTILIVNRAVFVKAINSWENMDKNTDYLQLSMYSKEIGIMGHTCYWNKQKITNNLYTWLYVYTLLYKHQKLLFKYCQEILHLQFFFSPWSCKQMTCFKMVCITL